MTILRDSSDLAGAVVDVLSPLQIEVVRKLIPIVRGGKWPVGGKISDAALAREFGISRTPIRQVLQFLAEKGVVTQTENRGFVLVRVPSADDRLEAIVPPSEMDLLYRQIMHARANGLIGSEASETELLEHFGTSRGVVRRTLMRLSAEGLAERRDGHGWRFAECLDNRQAVNESYAFRAIIECGAVMEDTFRVDMEMLLALESEQTALLNAPLASIEGSAWFEANARFHETVVSWANNRFLEQAIRRQNSLRRMTEYAEFAELSEAGVRKAARDHLAILEAIKSDDRKLASAILFRHLSRSSASGEAHPARLGD
ncbi:GntR family transcriptional regulator [Rhizobium pusense]|uniref:GntR family transcriptional regulator n=3 Tax=Hyphomicrobiales TaxID=356 RepID=A0A6H0ZSU9_9HYPH|nr:GntR family transcriptional regulator [Agrobacterium pusense]MBW9081313.1 GntR family transcriptional regulator [Agrobacterium pusense]MDH2089126.1 GntR family transcriptional regulator [Agrobacterium pusense]QIX23094.1 GntR family transcriptional regulator [Agrobacterium pusense]TGR65641.1 GntR family transcriptional regulator [bacterium M00.F.Ca.ET.194.01.1.1]